MSSLRLALKKSLEENNIASGSGSKSTTFDSFIDYDEILRISKPKRKRAPSIDNSGDGDSTQKRRNAVLEDASISSLQTVDEPSDDINEESADQNIYIDGDDKDQSISSELNVETITENSGNENNKEVFESSQPLPLLPPDLSPSLPLSTSTQLLSQDVNTTISLEKDLDETDQFSSKIDDKNNSSNRMIATEDETSESVSITRNLSTASFEHDLEDSKVIRSDSEDQLQRDRSVDDDGKDQEQELDETEEEIATAAAEAEALKKMEAKKVKRRSGMLRALGITEQSSTDNLDETNTEPIENIRPLARAAAQVAKSRIASKATIIIPLISTPRLDENSIQVTKKSENTTKKATKKSIAKDSGNSGGVSASASSAATAAAVIENNTQSTIPEEPVAPWACCDTCEKWRKLPKTVDPSTLPEKWFCWMNEWDPNHNTCDAEEELEEVTTTTTIATTTATTAVATSNDIQGSRSSDRLDELGAGISSVNMSEITPKAIKSSIKGKKPGSSRLSSNSNNVSSNSNNNSSSQPDSDVIGSYSQLTSNLTLRTSGLDATDQYASSRLANKRRTSSMGSTKNGQVSLTESDKVNWVQCNRCTKWRKVPPTVPMDSLPDTWLCEQNTWNLAFARCSAKQEPENDVIPASSSVSTTGTTLSRSASQNSVTSSQRGASSALSASASSGLGISGSSASSFSTGTSSTSINQGIGTKGPSVPKKITIEWVCCERKNCQKWRKISPTINQEDLPEKWYCEFNTWDPERANCDAPEESDNENDTTDPAVVAARSQLILANSKGPGTLSYRRIIFGTDGKVRPIYSEKSKTGHGLFSFTVRVVAVNRNNSGNDNDIYEEPLKRVSYWYSSLYDESGINYTSSAKPRSGNSGSGSTNTMTAMTTNVSTSANPLSKSQMRLEELSKYYSDCPTDSALLHFSRSTIPIESTEKEETNEETNKETRKDSFETPIVVTQLPLRHVWPKKVLKVCELVENATFFEQREIFMSLIRSCMCASSENLSLTMSTLYELIKSAHFMSDIMNYYRKRVSLESLKMILRYMEDLGEVYVTTDSSGMSTIHYSRMPTNMNVNNSSNVNNGVCNAGGYDMNKGLSSLPPKLRVKKLKNEGLLN